MIVVCVFLVGTCGLARWYVAHRLSVDEFDGAVANLRSRGVPVTDGVYCKSFTRPFPLVQERLVRWDAQARLARVALALAAHRARHSAVPGEEPVQWDEDLQDPAKRLEWGLVWEIPEPGEPR